TARESERTGRMSQGLELGPMGTFTLRVVDPVYDGRKLLGYLELGQEIDAVMSSLKETAQIEIITLIEKKHLKRADWQQGMAMLSHPVDWEFLPNTAIVSNTLGEIPAQLKRIITNISQESVPSDAKVKLGDKDYSYWSMPLKDAADRAVGSLFLIHDTHPELSKTRTEMKIIGMIFLGWAMLLGALFYLILGKVDRKLERAKRRTAEEGKRREALQDQHLEELEKEIEAHEKTSQSLASTNARLEHLLMASPAVIYSREVENKHAPTFMSENIMNVIGYNARNFTTDPAFWAEHIHPEDRKKAISGISHAIEQGSHELEYRILGRDGTYRWILDSQKLLRGANGEPHEIVGFMVDITDRKEVEASTMNAERRISLHFQQTPLGIIEWNRDFEVISWNPAAENIFGYDAREAMGRSARDLIIPEEAQEHIDGIWHDLLQAQGGTRSTNANVTKDGRKIFCDWYNTTLVDPAGRVIGVASQVEDITERKILENAHLRANRALKTLSACNGSLIRAENPDSLRHDICQVLVESANYQLAWIGYAENNPEKSIKVVACAGDSTGYLDEIAISWGNNELGNGPSGAAIRSGCTQIVKNIEQHHEFFPWAEVARKNNFVSTVSIPLMNGDEGFGCISIYSSEPNAFDADEMALLEEMADDLSFGLETLQVHKERDQAHASLSNALLETVRAIALTVEKRDPYTSGHQNRVANLATGIAVKLGLDEDRTEGIRLGATIHDIGKIYVPAEILNRPGKLTEHEFGMIKSHPQVGYDIVSDVKFPWPVKEMILQHHERLDGTGYPNGLKENEIALEAKIIAVADTVEAITSHRPYRPALGIDNGLDEIRKKAGSWYDKSVVDACISLFKEDGFDWK
ncbi:MAG: PAS domain S-box protein, partial [Rhodospirillales bacterium]|nr:PAS domain S-box protein [Rhodospirillales bacterium]